MTVITVFTHLTILLYIDSGFARTALAIANKE